MPLLHHAIKKARQDHVRTLRNTSRKSHMKTMVKNVFELAREGKSGEAAKLLPAAFRAVDLAAKHHLLHRKNAARKKSALSRAVASKAPAA